MRFLDPNFKKNFHFYILQSILAMVIIFIILFLVNVLSNITVVASLASSIFVALSAPHSKSSHPRCLIGGYAVGVVCGVLMTLVNESMITSGIKVFGSPPYILTCALAVGISMFLMIIFNLEHPPAASLAMGLVSDPHELRTAAVAMASIIVIVLIKFIIKRWLKTLL